MLYLALFLLFSSSIFLVILFSSNFSLTNFSSSHSTGGNGSLQYLFGILVTFISFEIIYFLFLLLIFKFQSIHLSTVTCSHLYTIDHPFLSL